MIHSPSTFTSINMKIKKEEEIAQLKQELKETQFERDLLKNSVVILSKTRQDIYQFIELNKLEFSVEKICKVFEVSRNAYYNWAKKDASEKKAFKSLILKKII